MVLEETPPPSPGPREARVRIHAAGVNFIDVYHRTGLYPLPLPFTPGNEGAGVVESVGAEVTEVKPGDYWLQLKAGGKKVEPAYGSIIKVTP